MSNQPIIFFFIGDISNKKTITEFISYNHPHLRSIKGDNKRIFDKFCSSVEKKLGERLSINNNKISLTYYFTILAPSIFFFVCSIEEYKESIVYKLIDEIYEEKVYAMTTGKGDLNNEGRLKLKRIIEKYQERNIDKISEIEGDLDSMKMIVKDTIQKTVDNTLNLEDLEKRSQVLKERGKEYNNNTINIKRRTWWNNLKIKVIFFLIIILLILILAYRIIN